MELKLPPAIIFLLFGSLMYFLAEFLPVGYFDFFGRLLLSKVLMVLAIILAILALFQFARAKTTVNPLQPKKTSYLVTGGVYQISRNPMYLSLLLLLLAIGLVLGNAFNTLIAAGFVAYMNRFQIVPEERRLLEKFGKPYKEYSSLVRRWF
jgi:protein-S-isoprenylcysteine O-methyltransferase Ste14